MILGVFGPRDFLTVNYSNYPYIASCLEDYEVTKIITGGGKGVEQLGLRYAATKGLECQAIHPDYANHGKAGPRPFVMRNLKIIKLIDVGVLFWDGKDKFYYELISEFVFAKKQLVVRHME